MQHVKKRLKCRECDDRGWLLVSRDGRSDDLQIERCDACARFKTDSDAVGHVAALAKLVPILQK